MAEGTTSGASEHDTAHQPDADDDLDNRVAAIEATMSLLADHVSRTDAEIDILQVEVGRDKAPLYRRPSTWSVIVAIIAIGFSAFTAYSSSQRLSAEEVRNARAEVRQLLQRMTEIQRIEVEANEELEPGPAAQVSSILGAEQLLIGRQALEVMRRIPGQVTSNEYLVVGDTLFLVDQYSDAEAAFNLGFEKAVDTGNAYDQIRSLRGLAQTAYILQRFEAGRNYFQDALEVYVQIPPLSDYLLPFTSADIEIQWAALEINTGNCDEVSSHLEAAQQAIDSTLDILRPQLQRFLDQLAAEICVRDSR